MRHFLSLFLICFPTLVFSEPNLDLLISGPQAQLDRPEGVSFTPDGHHIAIVNAEGSSITFFSLDNLKAPSFTLSGPETMIHYPHDISFSQNGKWLAVANRTGNCVTIYERASEDYKYHLSPVSIIRNRQFHGVGGVCFSPTDPVIALASTYSNQVFLYLFDQGTVSKKPAQVIEHPSIDIADGLCFSPDGNLLAVTSHGNHTVEVFSKTPRKDGKLGFCSESVYIFPQEKSGLAYPHSVTFDREGAHLIISSAGGAHAASIFEITKSPFSIKTPATYQLNIFDENTHCLLQKMNNQECGGKGVSVSPDGKILLVCAPNEVSGDGVYFFRFK